TQISGATVDFNGATALQGLNLSAGALQGSGAVTIAGHSTWTGGTMDGRGTTTLASGAILDASSGGLLAAARALSNSGTINVNAGTVELTAFPLNAGSLNVASGATFSTAGNALANAGAGAIISGNGTVDLRGATLTNQATIAAGSSPGKLSINGDLVLTGTSRVDVEIAGGGTAGGGSDLIALSGRATLGGNPHRTPTRRLPPP